MKEEIQSSTNEKNGAKEPAFLCDISLLCYYGSLYPSLYSSFYDVIVKMIQNKKEFYNKNDLSYYTQISIYLLLLTFITEFRGFIKQRTQVYDS